MSLIWSLLGLGFVVFIHELGHLVAAIVLGVRVEVFSVGLGRPLWSRVYWGIRFQITPFLFGGYCKMKGSEDLALRKESIQSSSDSLLGTSPWRRFLIYAAGPLFNIIGSIFLFSLAFSLGFVSKDYPSQLFTQDVVDASGNALLLENGDRVLAIDNQKVEFFSDILQYLPLLEEEPRLFSIQRGDSIREERLSFSRESFLAHYKPLIPLVVESVQVASPAELSGLRAGDLIQRVNGYPVSSQQDLEILKKTLLTKSPEEGRTAFHFDLELLRDGKLLEITLASSQELWGIYFTLPQRLMKADHLPQAFYQAYERSLSLFAGMFMGVLQLVVMPWRLFSEVSGPVGIVSQMGQTMELGIAAWLSFLAFINLALAVMNLALPVPVLDGGQMLIALVELVSRRRLSYKVLQGLYTVGVFFLIGLLLAGLINDLSGFF